MAQKSEAELEQDRLAAEAATADAGEGEPEPVEPVTPTAAAAAAVTPTGNAQVDQLVQAALAEALPKALSAALSAQQEAAAKEAAERVAREQGDYKTLYEASEKDRKTLELGKWRGEALAEAGLDAKWYDSIQGSTKEEMVASAKAFKKNLDAELKSRSEQIVEESPGTPRGGGKGSRQRSTNQPTGAQRTDATLRGAFSTRTLPMR